MLASSFIRSFGTPRAKSGRRIHHRGTKAQGHCKGCAWRRPVCAGVKRGEQPRCWGRSAASPGTPAFAGGAGAPGSRPERACSGRGSCWHSALPWPACPVCVSVLRRGSAPRDGQRQTCSAVALGCYVGDTAEPNTT